MYKWVLTMFLATLSISSAAAEWVKVGGDEDVTVYANPASIRKAGHMVKTWLLSDYKTPDVLQYLSRKYQHEYDCKEERFRTLYMAFHTGSMGEGTFDVMISEPVSWMPVPPDSTLEPLWQFACGKR